MFPGRRSCDEVNLVSPYFSHDYRYFYLGETMWWVEDKQGLERRVSLQRFAAWMKETNPNSLLASCRVRERAPQLELSPHVSRVWTGPAGSDLVNDIAHMQW